MKYRNCISRSTDPFEKHKTTTIRDSIVVSIPACHAGDRGSIPRLGVLFLFSMSSFFNVNILLFKLYLALKERAERTCRNRVIYRAIKKFREL